MANTQSIREFLNLQMLGKCVVIVCAMFGFGYALVPLYKAICEITGLNYLTKRDDAAARKFANNTQVDKSRKVVVEFDANARGTWLFKPRSSSVEAHPGELVTIVYELQSTIGRDSKGQAIPSYAPKGTESYFHKLECFCFQQQALKAHETREFPVVFVVDPKLPKDVNTITLSYTFFEYGPQGAIPSVRNPNQASGTSAAPEAVVKVADRVGGS
jgi:cytochrome c oxidase assembly protein subunit 11